MYSALTFLHLYDLLFCIKAQGSQGYLKIVLTMYLVVLSINNNNNNNKFIDYPS